MAVEWLISLRNYFGNFGTRILCIQARNSSSTSFDVPKVCEMLLKTLKHNLRSNGARMVDFVVKLFLQLRYPDMCIQARNTSSTSFDVLKVCEMLLNTLKLHLRPKGGRMVDFVVKLFSQLRYPDIVHSGPKHKFYLV